jgi:hypothetical protein
MEELTKMVELMEQPGAPPLTNEQVGRFATLFERAKIVGKAANTTAFNRLMAGAKIPGWKLVNGKANRVWKDGVEPAALEAFGEAAFEPAKLKSPAAIEQLPLGTDFAARWASKPDVGLTVAPASDRRTEVSPDTKSLFTDVTKEDPMAKKPTLTPSPEAAAAAQPKKVQRRGGKNAAPPVVEPKLEPEVSNVVQLQPGTVRRRLVPVQG